MTEISVVSTDRRPGRPRSVEADAYTEGLVDAVLRAVTP